MGKFKFEPRIDKIIRGVVETPIRGEVILDDLNDAQINRLSHQGHVTELDDTVVEEETPEVPEPEVEDPTPEPTPEPEPDVEDPTPEPTPEPDMPLQASEPTDDEIDNMSDEELEEVLSKM